MSLIFSVTVLSLVSARNLQPLTLETKQPLGFKMCSDLCHKMPDCRFTYYDKVYFCCKVLRGSKLLSEWIHSFANSKWTHSDANPLLTSQKKQKGALDIPGCPPFTRFVTTRAGRRTCVLLNEILERRNDVTSTRRITNQSASKGSRKKTKRIDHVTASYKYPNVVYACGMERVSEMVVLNTRSDPPKYFSPHLPSTGLTLGLATGRCTTDTSRPCIYILLRYNLKVYIFYLKEQRHYKYDTLARAKRLASSNNFQVRLIGFAKDDGLQFYFLKYQAPKTVVLQGNFTRMRERKTISGFIQFFDVDSKGQKVLFGTGGNILLTYLDSNRRHFLDIRETHIPACIAYRDKGVLIVDKEHPYRVTLIKQSW